MATLITLGKFILSLSILVTLHECGHFFPARWFKTRVERFYLFFHPWFSIWKKKIGETTYGIGWLPLGGYVKIAGMMDESMDREQMAGPPQPWEFRSKPAWQRLIIMLGGIIVNFILGIVIFSMIFFKWGEQYIANDDMTHGIAVYELGEQMGLEDGDKILAVGDYELETFGPSEVVKHIVVNGQRTLQIQRDGQEQTLILADSVARNLSKFENQKKGIFSFRIPSAIGEVAEGSAAARSGIKKKDRVLSLNAIPTPYYDQFTKAIKGRPNETIHLKLLRGTDSISVSATLDTAGILGIMPYIPEGYLTFSSREYSLGTALAAGWNKAWGLLGDQTKAFGQMFAGAIPWKESLGGPIAIAGMFQDDSAPLSWDWKHFWSLTAMLSMILGFMNLLPIPGLDGGHVVFLLWEMITGRKPSQQFMERALMFGFLILMTFMIFVFGNDLMRLMK